MENDYLRYLKLYVYFKNMAMTRQYDIFSQNTISTHLDTDTEEDTSEEYYCHRCKQLTYYSSKIDLDSYPIDPCLSDKCVKRL